MTILPSSSNRSRRAWTVSFGIHATAMFCAVGLLRGLHPQVQPPPLHLDLLLVEPEISPVSTTESIETSSELGEADPSIAPASAESPVLEQHPMTTQQTVTHRDTASRADTRQQDVSPRITNIPAPTPDKPKQITSLQPIPEALIDNSQPIVSALVDGPTPILDRTQQEDIADIASISTAERQSVMNESSAQTANQVQAQDLPSLQSATPAIEATDSGVSTPPEHAGSAEASATTASGDHASVTGRTSSSRSNYSWLNAALHRRVKSLLVYPRSARMQGWGGRVVVRATIKDDGTLLDARVVESSGYEILDDDAIRLMQRVFPIELQQDLGRPRMVLTLPITYTPER